MKHTTITNMSRVGSVHVRDASVLVSTGTAIGKLNSEVGDAVRLELRTVGSARSRVKTFRMSTAVPHSLRWLAVVTGDRKLVSMVAELLEDSQ